jgi:SAM-dependent methyltransferase
MDHPLLMSVSEDRPYREALSRIHHEAFGFHADACAPGILELLAPIRDRDGLVVEIGCGSGLLSRHLVDAGHRVIATDASPAMLDIARSFVPEALDHRVVALPDDPLPACDAVVSTGHALSYLPDRERLEEALLACARALRSGGVLALDLEDLDTRDAQLARPPTAWLRDDWAMVVERASDAPDHFARLMTMFLREPDGRYRREFERHDNVLVDVDALVRPLLEGEGMDVDIARSFGDEANMEGLRVVKARRPT